MYLAGGMIVLGAGKYLFVWDPILYKRAVTLERVPNRAIRFAVLD
eukprot:COSAG02_NODE_2127_length_9742_cov_32.510318_7_plen_45_part_00